MAKIVINLDEENKENHSAFAFGKAGWGVILYCMAMFWFYVGFVNDGSNILAPAVAEHIGVMKGTVLNCNSIAGIVGVFLFILIGSVNSKVGPRVVSGVTCIIAGITYLLTGNAPNLVVYTICMSIVVGCIMSAGYIAGGSLVSKWFPKKKGLVMGYTTMGHNLASAFYVPFLAALVGSYGVCRGVVIPSILSIVLGIFGLLFIRSTPQERNMNPDNVSDEKFAAEYVDTADQNGDGGWSVKKLLCNKSLWLVAITTGFFQICSVGVMSQMVSRNMELGMSQTTAVSIMTVLACIGVFGSFIIGVFDDKFGTKRTMIFFACWYITALICNITETTVGIYLSIFMIGMAIGGSANFTTSLPASVFGRVGFDKVNSVLFPLQGLITALCFAVNGIVLNLTGSLRYAYIVFACIAGINIILIALIDEHKYNQDYAKELVVRRQTEERIREIEQRVRAEVEAEWKRMKEEQKAAIK